MIEQHGLTELEESKEIFSLAKSLLELDNNEISDKIVIDVTEYLLQIKFASLLKEFKWKAIPRGWSDVEIISHKIIKLNNKVIEGLSKTATNMGFYASGAGRKCNHHLCKARH